MLPLNARQLGYMDVAHTTWSHKERIEKYAKDNNIKFDLIVSKLRNGIHAGSIISTYLRLPFGVIEVNPYNGLVNMLWPFDIDRNKELNILVVDTVSVTGTSLRDMVAGTLKEQPNAKVHTYATFISDQNQLDLSIPGLVVKDYMQGPWDWLSYTPQSHLERLESGDDNSYIGKDYFVAVSSKEVLDKVEILLGKNIPASSIHVYQNYAADKNVSRSNSGFSSLDLREYKRQGIDVYFGPLKRVITDKVEFIRKNGVTHFIEDSLEEATVISNLCPVTHVLYIEKGHLIRVNNYPYDVNSLNF